MRNGKLFFLILVVVTLGLFSSIDKGARGDDPISANREALSNDLANLAARAQEYYYRPNRLGGGGESFIGLQLGDLTSRPTNANGCYVLTSSAGQKIILDATGTETGDDANPVSVTMAVFPDSMYVTYNN